VTIQAINNFHAKKISENALQIAAQSKMIRAIDVCEGKLFTREKIVEATILEGFAIADAKKDIAQLCVLNRYQSAQPANAFILGSGLKQGAIASTVAHDSHNIIAMGADSHSISLAINALIDTQGGICVVANDQINILPLPIAGLMSDKPGEVIAQQYADLDKLAKNLLGITLNAPFMTLSFMALLVIPELKLSDKGLFDGRSFQFTSIFV
jgi:adenine deaminase